MLLLKFASVSYGCVDSTVDESLASCVCAAGGGAAIAPPPSVLEDTEVKCKSATGISSVTGWGGEGRCSLILSLSLSLAHTHTHSHTCMHSLTHACVQIHITLDMYVVHQQSGYVCSAPAKYSLLCLCERGLTEIIPVLDERWCTHSTLWQY